MVSCKISPDDVLLRLKQKKKVKFLVRLFGWFLALGKRLPDSRRWLWSQGICCNLVFWRRYRKWSEVFISCCLATLKAFNFLSWTLEVFQQLFPSKAKNVILNILNRKSFGFPRISRPYYFHYQPAMNHGKCRSTCWSLRRPIKERWDFWKLT